MKFPILLTSVLLLLGCARNPSDSDVALFEANGIPFEIVSLLLPDARSIVQLSTVDSDYNEIDAQGVCIRVDPSSGRDFTVRFRELLRDSLFQAYLREVHYGHAPDEIAVVKTKSDIDYLKIIRTDGINYDLTAEQVLAKYVEWNQIYDLALIGAGRDWLEATIQAEFVDWPRLAADVYAFCPDVVDQGTNTVEALEAEMRRERTLFLWWD
jgi:hypothetical protein